MSCIAWLPFVGIFLVAAVDDSAVLIGRVPDLRTVVTAAAAAFDFVREDAHAAVLAVLLSAFYLRLDKIKQVRRDDRLVMLLTGQESIQEVLFFPQMRPEKIAPRDKKEVFASVGIPEEWVPVLHKAGYLTLESVQSEEKPGRLLQQLMDIKKKYQLELSPITLDQVTAWVASASQS